MSFKKVSALWRGQLSYVSTISFNSDPCGNSRHISSADIHAFQEFLKPVLNKISFTSHWLLSHIAEREIGMNPVAMTIINPWK